MKTVLFILLLGFLNFVSIGQKEIDSTYYYNDTDFGENEGVSIFVKNVVSKKNYAKLACIVDNKSKQYVILFKDQSEFVFSGQSLFPEKEQLGKVIEPYKKEMFTIETKNETQYLKKSFDFKPGGIFSFSPGEQYTEAPSFHLPVNQNQFSADNFVVQMKNIKKETDQTVVKFECTYTGDKVAVISPSNTVMLTSDGKEWANAKSDMKPKVLQPGEKTTFTLVWEIPGSIVDMQFAEMDIIWKNTFAESSYNEIVFKTKTINIDQLKTDQKKKKQK